MAKVLSKMMSIGNCARWFLCCFDCSVKIKDNDDDDGDGDGFAESVRWYWTMQQKKRKKNTCRRDTSKMEMVNKFYKEKTENREQFLGHRSSLISWIRDKSTIIWAICAFRFYLVSNKHKKKSKITFVLSNMSIIWRRKSNCCSLVANENIWTHWVSRNMRWFAGEYDRYF